MDSDMMQTRLFRLFYLAATWPRKMLQVNMLCVSFRLWFNLLNLIIYESGARILTTMMQAEMMALSTCCCCLRYPHTTLLILCFFHLFCLCPHKLKLWFCWRSYPRSCCAIWEHKRFDAEIYIDFKLAKTMLSLKYSGGDGGNREPQKSAQGATQIEWIISASRCVGAKNSRRI